MKIKIRSVNDRVTMAGILIKNGYTVTQFKEKRENNKSYDYGLIIEEPEEMVVTTKEDD